MEDLAGKHLGMLTVEKFAGYDEHNNRLWECRCECGNTCVRAEQTLKNKKHIHSCGCYSKRNLRPGTSEICRKAGLARAEKCNRNGMNINMLYRESTIRTNTSGVQGVSWSKSAKKWHVYVGYKNYRCTLGYVKELEDAKQLRMQAVEAIKNDTFEDFYYEIRCKCNDFRNKISCPY